MNSEASRFFRALEKGDTPTFVSLLAAQPGLKDSVGPAESARFNKNAPAIVIAAELGRDEIARTLLAMGADVAARGALAGTALHWAAWFGFADIVGLLLRAGSDPHDDATEWHCAPLFWAVHGFSRRGDCLRRDQLRAAKLLLDAGACPNPANNDGTTVLSLLTEADDQPMIDLLTSTQNRRQP